ncbi:MAG: YceI family protein [Ferruginibacter sp.]
MNTQKWVIDPAHSEVSFKVRHMMISNVKGEFKTFSADITTRDDDFSKADVKVTVDAASIATGNTDRDVHVKAPDFFDVEKYPEIMFKGKKLEPVDGDGSFEIYGELTIKGITKEVKLDVEFGGIQKDPWGNEKAGFSVNGKIDRTEWDLKWNAALETGGVLVSDTVNINCEVQLMRSA